MVRHYFHLEETKRKTQDRTVGWPETPHPQMALKLVDYKSLKLTFD